MHIWGAGGWMRADFRSADPQHLGIHIAAAHNSETPFLRPGKGNSYHLSSHLIYHQNFMYANNKETEAYCQYASAKVIASPPSITLHSPHIRNFDYQGYCWWIVKARNSRILALSLRIHSIKDSSGILDLFSWWPQVTTTKSPVKSGAFWLFKIPILCFLTLKVWTTTYISPKTLGSNKSGK